MVQTASLDLERSRQVNHPLGFSTVLQSSRLYLICLFHFVFFNFADISHTCYHAFKLFLCWQKKFIHLLARKGKRCSQFSYKFLYFAIQLKYYLPSLQCDEMFFEIISRQEFLDGFMSYFVRKLPPTLIPMGL